MRDVWDYIRALMGHWKAFLTGSGATAALFLMLGMWPKMRVDPPQFAGVFIFLGLLVAGFFAWAEKHRKLKEADQRIAAQASRRAIRDKLSEFLDQGESLKERAAIDGRSGPLRPEPPWTEAAAWTLDVLSYLKSTPELDASYATRFRFPPIQPPVTTDMHADNSALWNAVNQRTVALLAFLSELKD